MTVTRKFVTLDANATEPLRPEAREAVLAAWAIGGNPSSVHGG
ncbi:cysteine desulfurase, partial [Ameyamaea chiangmaiensis]|nr:cysteine desulfurase [Ameyamaea chiangmaiensis]